MAAGHWLCPSWLDRSINLQSCGGQNPISNTTQYCITKQYADMNIPKDIVPWIMFQISQRNEKRNITSKKIESRRKNFTQKISRFFEIMTELDSSASWRCVIRFHQISEFQLSFISHNRFIFRINIQEISCKRF